MKKFVVVALILLGASVVRAADSGNAVTGLWLTENHRSIIKIEACGDKLCGHVFWIIKDGMQTDSKNPDEKLRGRAMCGLKIMWGFEPDDDGDWSGGRIYKADDGDTYHAELEMMSPNKLKVRGYVGIPLFGVSQTWSRVKAADYPACKNGK
jgi:uncharacterized protein (DUF2147 family)